MLSLPALPSVDENMWQLKQYCPRPRRKGRCSNDPIWRTKVSGVLLGENGGMTRRYTIYPSAGSDDTRKRTGSDPWMGPAGCARSTPRTWSTVEQVAPRRRIARQAAAGTRQRRRSVMRCHSRSNAGMEMRTCHRSFSPSCHSTNGAQRFGGKTAPSVG